MTLELDQSEAVIESIIKSKFFSCCSAVKDNVCKHVFMYGPYVYCLDEVDNGKQLSYICVEEEPDLELGDAESRFQGAANTNRFKAKRFVNDIKGKFDENKNFKFEDIECKAIPCCLWANRSKGKLIVWLKVRVKCAMSFSSGAETHYVKEELWKHKKQSQVKDFMERFSGASA
ncbi:MAG: hypothetical protein HUJ51_03620 [Eggerthellaceae bacterium]|nr:hypothetical protein [Eggerthellaceae bacterium]